MKKLAIVLCIMALSQAAKAQMIVWDPFVMSTLVICHSEQQEKLKEIKTNETAIYAAQAFISKQVQKIKEIEEKLHARLKTVTSIVRDGANIIHARDIAKDLGRYQASMIDYVRENPALLLVAYDTEAALVERTASLLTYLATALTGTDLNLLDNRQRMEIIEYVVNELRVMRGIARTVANKMRVASRTGALDHLHPFHLAYPDRDRKILENILTSL